MNPIYLQVFTAKPGKGERRRFEIIETAIHSIAESGVTETTFESIAASLNLGRSHIAYYFPNFAALMEATLKFIAATGQAMTVKFLAKDKNWRSQILNYGDAQIEWVKAYPSHAKVLMFFYHLCTFDEAYRKLHAEMKRVGQSRIIEITRSGRPDLTEAEARKFAFRVYLLITGTVVHLSTGEHPYSQKEIRSLLRSSLERMIDELP